MSLISRFRRARQLVRIGPLAVELWRSAGDEHERIAQRALSERGSLYRPQALADALGSLAGSLDAGPVDVVIESAFAPVLLVSVGDLWRDRQIDALLRHRFNTSFADAPDPVALWGLRVDHKAGEPMALAYGLPPSVKALIAASFAQANRPLGSIAPAFHWGLGLARPWRRWPGGNGAWVWREQDRSIVARFEGPRARWLHQGAGLAPDDEAAAIAQAGLAGHPDELRAAAGWGAIRGEGRPSTLQSGELELASA